MCICYSIYLYAVASWVGSLCFICNSKHDLILVGFPLVLLCSNPTMAMGSLEHTPGHQLSIVCLSHHTQGILPSHLVDILLIGITPLCHLLSILPRAVAMITTVNKILGLLHLRLMGLLITTVSHHLLVITNLDRVMLRIAMVGIIHPPSQGMVSHKHISATKL